MAPTDRFGDKAADAVARFIGSWRFIIMQSCFLAAWLIFNTVHLILHHWDNYPFILLNLMLSFQAAFTAPVIMISQNRQDKAQREKAEVDKKASEKMDRYLLHLMEAVYAQGQVILDEIEEDDDDDRTKPGNEAEQPD